MMIVCPHCGSRVSDEDGTCFVCGGDLPELPPIRPVTSPQAPVPQPSVPPAAVQPPVQAQKKSSPALFFGILAGSFCLLCAIILSSSSARNKRESESLADAFSKSVQEESPIVSDLPADPVEESSTPPEDTPAPEHEAEPEPVQEEPPAIIEETPAEDPVKELPATEESVPTESFTMSQKNAIDSAKEYLEYSPFSRNGLIDQLSSEYGSGFNVEDATFAVDYLEQNGFVDWNQQAVKAAQEYLEHSSFSRDRLVDQLSSEYGSQFTPEQAEYAADQVGY